VPKHKFILLPNR